MYQKLTNMLGLPPWAKYVLELLAVAILFGLLVLLNWALGLQRDLSGPTALRPIWLGLIGVLIYAAFRLLFFIIGQLPGARADFPDIQQAMIEAQEMLQEAGIDIRDAPLFLVLGMDVESEQAFAQSPLVGQSVRITGRRHPVHFFGDAQGLWVTLPGVSALSKQKDAPLERIAPPADPDKQPSLDELESSSVAEPSQFATIGAADISTALKQAKSTVGRAPVRIASQERELARKRFEYFVKLLREARSSVCPLNAVMVALPFDWLDSPEKCRLADTAGLDLTVLQQAVGVKCLTVAVFTEIENSPEFSAYIQRLDKTELERRCGCGYPPLTAYSEEDGKPLHAWLVEYFERQVYELYQRDLDDPDNAVLFRFLSGFRSWKTNFSRLMQYAFPSEGEPLYFGGVYFASAGTVGKAARPFLDGVLAKIRREHDDVVGWNDQSFQADKRYQTGSLMAMGLIAALTLVNAALIVLILI